MCFGRKITNKKPLFVAASVLCALCFNFAAHAFEVTLPAFEEGGKLPKVYACSKQGGKDHSWKINIRDVPDVGVTLVIIMDDPDAQSVIGKTYVHWNVCNIPVDTESLPAKKRGKKIGSGELGYNGSRKKSYQGMCPPNGEHKYILAVYALNDELKKRLDNMTREKFEKKYQDYDCRKGGT
jgi:Raf kinase inhibitor-like YbhB/YbcL family protein